MLLRSTTRMCKFSNGNLFFLGLHRIVDVLIKNGADVNIKDNEMESALSLAAAAGNKKFLLKTNWNYDNGNNSMYSLGHEKVVKKLIKAGADINLEIKFRRRTPLIIAAINGESCDKNSQKLNEKIKCRHLIIFKENFQNID